MERLPKRIQRKRVKGWKIPENTIYVGRPSKWGNPIKIYEDCIFINISWRRKILNPWIFYCHGNIEDVVNLFERFLDGTEFYNEDLQHWADYFKNLDINELRGKDLSCWCGLTRPCHANVLLKYANK